MSANISAKARVGGAMARLRKLVQGLEAIGNGRAVDVAVAAGAALINGVTRDKVARHTLSGTAAGTRSVVGSKHAITLTSQKYLHFHRWWPFSKGLPRFIVAKVTKVFREETKRLLAS